MSPLSPWLQERQRTVQTVVILLLAAVPRVWLAFSDQGIFWPDEIYQSLEQAHRFAFGYGFTSWEFHAGARSWVFPGFIGLVWKLASAVGVERAATLVVLAKLVMVGFALLGIYASMRLAEKLGGELAGLFAGVLGAAFPAAIVFGSRCMTEMASGPVLVLAALLAYDSGRRRQLAAGALAALSIYLRYQNGLVVLGLLAFLLVGRRWRDSLWFGAAAVVVGLAGGLLDLVTWGSPFHSFGLYLRYNLLEGRASEYGTASGWFYVTTAWTATGPALVAVLVGAALSARRALVLFVTIGIYVVVHSLVPHKELRFLMPVVPLLLALAGAGLGQLLVHLDQELHRPEPRGKDRGGRRAARRKAKRARAAPRVTAADTTPGMPRWPAWLAAALLAALMGWHTSGITFGQMGQHEGPASGKRLAFGENDAINRLLWRAGEHDDMCGFVLVGHPEIWSGAYAYLHRDVPFLQVSGSVLRSGKNLDEIWQAANYALVVRGLSPPPAFREVARLKKHRVMKRPGTCIPAPTWYTRVFPE